MASPTHLLSSQRAVPAQRYRRSSFNGAKQLSAAQKPRRLVLLAIGTLVLGLAAAIGTIAFHLLGGQ